MPLFSSNNKNHQCYGHGQQTESYSPQDMDQENQIPSYNVQLYPVGSSRTNYRRHYEMNSSHYDLNNHKKKT